MDKIRQTIRRNRLKQLKEKRHARDVFLSVLSEEEKFAPHSLAQVVHVSRNGRENDRRHTFSSTFIRHSFFSILIFILMLASFIWTSKDSFLQRYTSYFLQEDFPFATVMGWYEEHVQAVGLPIFQPSHDASEQNFTEHEVMETFQMNGRGLILAPPSETELYAAKEGVVIFAGMDDKTKRTIIVQHADQTKAIYGNLSRIDVPLYKRVKVNERIGSFEKEGDSSYFLALEKRGEYMDPIVYFFGDHSK